MAIIADSSLHNYKTVYCETSTICYLTLTFEAHYNKNKLRFL